MLIGPGHLLPAGYLTRTSTLVFLTTPSARQADVAEREIQSLWSFTSLAPFSNCIHLLYHFPKMLLAMWFKTDSIMC